MKTYLELAAHSRQYLHKNILTTLNQKSLENFQLSEKIDLPFFIIYYHAGSLRFSYSLGGPVYNAKTDTYKDGKEITEEKYIINKDLYTACMTMKENIGPKTEEVLKRNERLSLQVFYIPESTTRPYTIDYAPLKGCGYIYVISENYRQSKEFTLDFINAYNTECSKDEMITFNPYYYVDLKKAIYTNSTVVSIEDTDTLNGEALDDEIYKAIKKTVESIKFPMQTVCPEQKLEAVYLTLDRGKNYKEKGLTKRFTYSFFPVADNIHDKITSDAVEDNMSRLPYELLLSNFGTYVTENKDKIAEIGRDKSKRYITKVLYIIEDYIKKTDFSFLTSMGIDYLDLRPPKLRYYMSPINIPYIEDKIGLSKAFVIQLNKSELVSSVTCTLVNFLCNGLNNAAWTIYLNQDIKCALKDIFSELKK